MQSQQLESVPQTQPFAFFTLLRCSRTVRASSLALSYAGVVDVIVRLAGGGLQAMGGRAREGWGRFGAFGSCVRLVCRAECRWVWVGCGWWWTVWDQVT